MKADEKKKIIRIHTKYYSLIHCITDNTTYISYQNKHIEQPSHFLASLFKVFFLFLMAGTVIIYH